MKILKLKIQNLNSLKGEFEIDFEKPPLKNSGLFLITGKTGAGKTTILDAITLALYGEAPRFEDVKGKPEGEMMTHGTFEAMAELTFQVDSGIFVSKWQMRRIKKSGKLDNPKRELFQLMPDGTRPIISDKIMDANKEVEKLLGGLNFTRFKRSILLAQGDFSNFLRGAEDRSNILERITDTMLYSDISKNAAARFKEEEQKLSKLKQEASFSQLLSADELSDLEREQKELTTASEYQKEQSDAFSQWIAWFEQMEKLSLQKNNCEVEQENLEKEKTAFSDNFARLERHRKAAPLQPDLRLLDNLQKELGELSADIKKYSQNKIDLTIKLELADAQLAEKQNALQALEQEITNLEPVWEEVKQLDSQIAALATTHKATETELAELLSKEQTIISEINSFSKKIADSELTLEKGKAWLLANSGDEKLLNSDIAMQLQSFYKDWQHNTISKNEKNSELEAIVNKVEEKKELQKKEEEKKQKIEKELDSLKKSAATLSTQYDAEENGEDIEQVLMDLNEELEEIALLSQGLSELSILLKQRGDIYNELDMLSENKLSTERALENSDYYSLQLSEQETALKEELNYQAALCNRLQLNMSLEEHRMHLEEGVACPLCLSDKHGFKKGDIPVDFNSQFNREEQKLIRLREVEANLDKKSKDLLNDISYYLHQLKTLSDKEVAQLKDLDEVQTKTIKLFLDYPMLEQEMLDYDSDTLQEEKKSWQDRNSLLETIKSKLSALQKDEIAKQEKLSAAKSRIEIFEKEIDELLLQKREKDAQLLVLSATGETQLPQINALLKDLNTTVASLEELQKAIKDIEKRKKLYEDALKKVQKVEQELAELNAKIATQNSLLQNQKEQIAAKQEKNLTETTVLSDLKMQRAELFEDKNPQEEQRRRREALEHLRTDAENLKNNKNALFSDLQANNKLLEDKVQTETQKQKEEASLGLELIEKAKQIGFDSLEQLRAAMLPEEDAKRWKQQKEGIEKRWEKNNELLLEYSAAYNESAEKRPTELSLKEIQVAKKLAEEERDAAIQAIGKIRQKLEVHFANETRQKEFTGRISLQTKEHNRWQQLYDLIGHADGKKFRKFAQNITLSKLIELANKHLQHFASGRYLLEKRGDDDLEIDILDAYQANNRRILSTLSGGETFLASLSLALGLSDLAGGRANIESLFIDEGFGTLDAETLNIALSALQMLQNQGKTIGIISHVQQLQNAIDVQIKVQSKSGGFSELVY